MDALDIRISARPVGETSAAAENYKVKMINLGGVLMESGQMHEQEARLLVEMNLPDNVRVSMKGRVTTCLAVKGSDVARYDVGIEFTDISDQDKAKLKKFIHWLYLKDAGFTE